MAAAITHIDSLAVGTYRHDTRTNSDGDGIDDCVGTSVEDQDVRVTNARHVGDVMYLRSGSCAVRCDVDEQT